MVGFAGGAAGVRPATTLELAGLPGGGFAMDDAGGAERVAAVAAPAAEELDGLVLLLEAVSGLDTELFAVEFGMLMGGAICVLARLSASGRGVAEEGALGCGSLTEVAS